ncbi:hypothetical protein SK128_021522 [Halocaridina rubra]|uniref:Uncharacterized protein n=1 Tax=Halocaridina rubra TaxID=373956 RepID=A0AAN9AAI4_HALRR
MRTLHSAFNPCPEKEEKLYFTKLLRVLHKIQKGVHGSQDMKASPSGPLLYFASFLKEKRILNNDKEVSNIIQKGYMVLSIRTLHILAVFLKGGLHGQTVCRTRFDRQVFEVMFERVNGLMVKRPRVSSPNWFKQHLFARISLGEKEVKVVSSNASQLNRLDEYTISCMGPNKRTCPSPV